MTESVSKPQESEMSCLETDVPENEESNASSEATIREKYAQQLLFHFSKTFVCVMESIVFPSTDEEYDEMDDFDFEAYSSHSTLEQMLPMPIADEEFAWRAYFALEKKDFFRNLFISVAFDIFRSYEYQLIMLVRENRKICEIAEDIVHRILDNFKESQRGVNADFIKPEITKTFLIQLCLERKESEGIVYNSEWSAVEGSRKRAFAQGLTHKGLRPMAYITKAYRHKGLQAQRLTVTRAYIHISLQAQWLTIKGFISFYLLILVLENPGIVILCDNIKRQVEDNDGPKSPGLFFKSDWQKNFIGIKKIIGCKYGFRLKFDFESELYFLRNCEKVPFYSVYPLYLQYEYCLKDGLVDDCRKKLKNELALEDKLKELGEAEEEKKNGKDMIKEFQTKLQILKQEEERNSDIVMKQVKNVEQRSEKLQEKVEKLQRQGVVDFDESSKAMAGLIRANYNVKFEVKPRGTDVDLTHPLVGRR